LHPPTALPPSRAQRMTASVVMPGGCHNQVAAAAAWPLERNACRAHAAIARHGLRQSVVSAVKGLQQRLSPFASIALLYVAPSARCGGSTPITGSDAWRGRGAIAIRLHIQAAHHHAPTRSFQTHTSWWHPGQHSVTAVMPDGSAYPASMGWCCPPALRIDGVVRALRSATPRWAPTKGCSTPCARPRCSATTRT
jgi:hypothetical protein